MSQPIQPTPTTIATEAFQLYARRNPTASEITRVTNSAMELVKDDLAHRGTAWDFLRMTSYQATTAYVNTYTLPSDYKKLISVRVGDGTRRGTAQTGASTTITLASTDSGGADDTQGKWIAITGGTGVGQALQCKTYSSTTKLATMQASWTTTPDNTSTYLVVDRFDEVELHTIYDRDNNTMPGLPDKPSDAFHIANATEGNLVLSSAPDQIYILELVYYADILKMDTDTSTDPRYANVLRLLNGLFIQGVYAWLCQNDSRFTIQKQIYDQKLSQLTNDYLYPNNESTFHVRLDY